MPETLNWPVNPLPPATHTNLPQAKGLAAAVLHKLGLSVPTQGSRLIIWQMIHLQKPILLPGLPPGIDHLSLDSLETEYESVTY